MSKKILTKKRKFEVMFRNFFDAPGYSSCGCCGGTWGWNKNHTTLFNGVSGCFPLCEWCWSRLTIDERIPYYEALISKWEHQSWSSSNNSKEKIQKLRKERGEIIEAVTLGL